MAKVLTITSNVTCGHKGNVVISSSEKLKVGGDSVLVKGSIENTSIPDCKIVPAAEPSGPTAIPCKMVTAVTSGEATKLKVNGKSVMLAEELHGETNGMLAKLTPQKLLSATSNQNKLTAT